MFLHEIAARMIKYFLANIVKSLFKFDSEQSYKKRVSLIRSYGYQTTWRRGQFNFKRVNGKLLDKM